ncbi:MAG: 2-hydroxyacyl-CoA dehydratase subunit D [Thermovenabulum sp.]|uniref:2-hydroxyacyl-CoA dehydratase subunit D n=1 Tax=Thermovenabulum sp. TaxID=3100335 RepID=UPI003C7DA4AA
MDTVRIYTNIIKRNMDKPEKVSKLINLGLTIAYYYVSFFKDKRIPKSLHYLNKYCIKSIKDSLENPQNSAWVNLFSPCEFLIAMDIKPLFIEAYSSFMSGFFIEDYLIDIAESRGISNTLCSYHKTFIGANELNILRKPEFMITTSMICDANIPTFRYLSRKLKVPLYIIDIPYKYSKEAVIYVKNQLLEMAKKLEEVFKRRLDIDKLREVVKTENKTRTLMNEYLNYTGERILLTTMTFEMYMLFASHVFIGSREILNFYEILVDDIKRAPERRGKGIFFVHLLPMFEKNFKDYFNFSDKFYIAGSDLNYDFLGEIDEKDPFRGIAEKLILTSFNGEINRKVTRIKELIEKIKPDGIIQFCNLGCKQSIGGTFIIKNLAKKMGIPFLYLDGDCVDKRNNQEGQNRTRLEAFLEML